MGVSLQDVENALGQLFNCFQTIHDFIAQDFVAPVEAFPGLAVNNLDFAHDACVQQVQSAMDLLYGPGTDFTGAAASSIATLIGDYFAQENKVSSYASFSLSSSLSCSPDPNASPPGIDVYMEQLNRLCRSTVQDMVSPLAAIDHIVGPSILVSDVWSTLQDVWQQIQTIWNPPVAYADSPGQVFEPPSQVSVPPGTFWEDVMDFMDFLGEVAMVVTVVIEVIKQIGIDVHIGELVWSQWQWINQMENLKDLIQQQNSSSQLPGNAGQTINQAVRNDILQMSANSMKTKMKGIMSKGWGAYAALCNNSPKIESQNNYGAGYATAYDSNGKLITYQTPYFFSPGLKSVDPKTQQPDPTHVEEQIVQDTINWLNAYNKAHPNAPITSMVLDIFTYKVPCGPQQRNCAGNLTPSGGQKSAWEQEIYAKTNPHVDTTIGVWTTNGQNSSKATSAWP